MSEMEDEVRYGVHQVGEQSDEHERALEADGGRDQDDGDAERCATEVAEQSRRGVRRR
jgi:hypothetical protein